MVNMGELFAHDRIFDIPMERVPVTERELSTASLEPEDLLFARQSLVLEGAGKCSIVKEITEPTVFESHLIRVRLDPLRAAPDFYYYYFKSPLSPVKSIVSQCAQAGIKSSDLAVLPVVFPPLPTQEHIADILSHYDALIENNRRQIKLLEEAAQRLYREWFVDLRFPGHEHTPISNGVPQGWRPMLMEDVCKTIGGGTPSTKRPEYYEKGTIPWVTPTDVTRNGSLVLLSPEKYITQEGLDNSSAKMVHPFTILMTSRASVGFFAVCSQSVCTNQGFIACEPKEGVTRMFLLFHLLSRVPEIRIKAGGSTYPEISKGTFRQLPLLLPAPHVMRGFDDIVFPIILLVEKLSQEILRLTEARDRLLPKLMSGEIEVQELP